MADDDDDDNDDGSGGDDDADDDRGGESQSHSSSGKRLKLPPIRHKQGGSDLIKSTKIPSTHTHTQLVPHEADSVFLIYD